MTAPLARLPDRFSRGSRATWVAAAALAVVVAIVVLRLVTNLVEPGVVRGSGGDFRDATYLPVQALLDGINPYDPAAYLSSSTEVGDYFPVYGPHHLLLHLPLTVLSLDAAFAAYAALTVVLTVVLAWVSLGLAGWQRTGPIILGTAALLLASNAGRANFVNLQPTILMVLGVYLALSDSHRDWVAAFGVALAFLKPQFGIPLVIILFLTGRAAVAWKGILVAGAASAPVVARLIDIEGGIGGVIGALGDNLQFAADTNVSHLRVDLASAFRVASPLVVGVLAAVILAVAIFSLRSRPDHTSPMSVVIATSAILLVLFHVNYDLLLLSWPILALAATVERDRRHRVRKTLLILLLVLMFNPLTSSFAIGSVGPRDLLAAISGILLLAILGSAVVEQRSIASGAATPVASGGAGSAPE